MTTEPTLGAESLNAESLEDVAMEILKEVGYPFDVLRLEIRAGSAWIGRAPKILLTLAGISPMGSLASAQAWDTNSNLRGNKKWIAQYNQWWGNGDVSSGSYDYFLRHGLRPLIDTGLAVEDPDMPTLRKPNSPAKVYGLSIPAVKLLKAFQSERRTEAICIFLQETTFARATYIEARAERTLKISLGNGESIEVSKDDHNNLQKAIVESFLPHFVPRFELIYLGETANREIICNEKLITELGLKQLFDDKLPDIVAYDAIRDWIIIVEAYHSSGAISTMRHDRLKQKLGKNARKTVFVTAFTTRAGYKAHANEIAWKTEVWIAESPTHLIHMDGERFLGPYS